MPEKTVGTIFWVAPSVFIRIVRLCESGDFEVEALDTRSGQVVRTTVPRKYIIGEDEKR